MTNPNDKTIDVLNDLIEYCKDGQHGYHTAAEDVKNGELKSLFNTYAQQRTQFVTELKEQVRFLGGDPEKAGSITGTIHRGWIDLKSAISNGDEKGILTECVRGDGAAEERYDKALTSELPTQVLAIVRHQHDEIKNARNQVVSLREKM